MKDLPRTISIEKHRRILRALEQALQKSLPKGVGLFHGKKILSYEGKEYDGLYPLLYDLYEPRDLIEIRKQLFQ